jgi:hypothetical protein
MMTFLTKAIQMIRKVKLTRSDVELAKHFNVPLEEVAKKKLPKSGRPVGSRNKKPTPAQMHKAASIIAKSNDPVSEFQKTLNEWDRMDEEVNLKDLCQKLQNALSLAYVELDALRQKTQLDRQAIIIEYLESRVK